MGFHNGTHLTFQCSLKWFMGWLRDKYGEGKAARCWERMGALAAKTVMSIQPTLVREYRSLFGNHSVAGESSCDERLIRWYVRDD